MSSSPQERNCTLALELVKAHFLPASQAHAQTHTRKHTRTRIHSAIQNPNLSPFHYRALSRVFLFTALLMERRVATVCSWSRKKPSNLRNGCHRANRGTPDNDKRARLQNLKLIIREHIALKGRSKSTTRNEAAGKRKSINNRQQDVLDSRVLPPAYMCMTGVLQVGPVSLNLFSIVTAASTLSSINTSHFTSPVACEGKQTDLFSL